LFSFGAVLYEMATGRLPFEGATAAVIFDGILNHNPVPPLELNPQLPPKLDEIIRTALEKDPDLRYQSAAEMRAELKRLKRDTTSGRTPITSGRVAVTPSTVRAAAAGANRRGLYIGLAAASSLIIADLALVYFLRGRSHSFSLQNMKVTQVTTAGNAGAAALSPDRRYIVYVLHEGEQESLWVEQLATGSYVQILPPEQANFIALSFTPDGNYVMFVRSDKSTTNFRYLYRIPVLGGTAQQLVRDVDSAPTFSPDGRQMAYTRGVLDPSSNRVLVANADGSGEHVLADLKGPGAGTATVSWSADGKTLAVMSPQFRDDAIQSVLATASVASSEVRELHVFAAGARAVAWLPDGHGVLAVGTDPESGRGQIYFVSYPDGQTSRFTNDLTNYDLCCLEISRDGDSLVALQNTTLSDVWVARGDGSDPKQITSGEQLGSQGLGWIGNQIVAIDSRYQWVLINSETRGKTSFTNDRVPHPQLSACRDGRHVIYTTFRDGKLELWRADADGSNPAKLPAKGVTGGGGCSPDSKSVFYAANNAVWSVPIEGGTPVKLDLPRETSDLSLDGKLLLYGRQRVVNGQMEAKMLVAPTDGGKPLYTFDAPYGLQGTRFSPDEKAIAFRLTRNRAANIWEQKLSGGDIFPLTKFTSEDMFAFSWSKDGNRLAFARGQHKTDVVMMSNLNH